MTTSRRFSGFAFAVMLLVIGGCGNDDPATVVEPPEDRGPDPYQFVRAPLADYTQIDRMGQPVVATVLLKTVDKNAFNEGDPRDDGDYAGKMTVQLNQLHSELDDDLVALGMTPCKVNDSVTRCLQQVVFRIVPDVLHLDLNDPSNVFPNGRQFQDSVVDRILAFALLDLTDPAATCGNGSCTVDTFVNLPLNPTQNELAFQAVFPYLAAPHP